MWGSVIVLRYDGDDDEDGGHGTSVLCGLQPGMHTCMTPYNIRITVDRAAAARYRVYRFHEQGIVPQKPRKVQRHRRSNGFQETI